MKNKNESKFDIEDYFKAKEKLHKELARAPFEEKIEMLFRLQEIANNIRQVRKPKVEMEV